VDETRKLAAILSADVVGFSRLTGADEDRTLARLRSLRSDLIDPTIAVHKGRVVKRTGDGALVEFRSVVDAVRCAIEVQNGMIERNRGLPPERCIDFRIGIHLGDVVEESDGDLMGDGVNVAARLEGIAKPGAICLSEDAYRQVSGRLDMEVTDLGQAQLKNIERPIHVYSLQVGVPVRPKSPEPAKPKRRSALLALGIGVVALVLIAGGAWRFLGVNPLSVLSTTPARAARLSVVVLPFANLSGDTAQDYFADGVTENLTTELARIRNSFVISRATAFTYKNKAIDAKAIGKELGVRYVLEGSVQRDQNRARVNVQLIDAESGSHIWADRFEEQIADLFKLQDQVVARLTNTLGLELTKAEAEKAAKTENPDAIDLAMRGWALQQQALQRPSKESFDAAAAAFERALTIDPDNVSALSGDAMVYRNAPDVLGSEWRTGIDYYAKIVGQADRALALAPNTGAAFFAKSGYFVDIGHYNAALSIANAGLAVNPNGAGLYYIRSLAELGLHQFDEAESDVRSAMKLSPRDPAMGAWICGLATAELGLGHFAAAAEDGRRGIEMGWRLPTFYAVLIAAYALDDKPFDAKAALDEVLKIEPKFNLKWVLGHYFHIKNLTDGLQKAGVQYE
jgi:adenylate cyclase